MIARRADDLELMLRTSGVVVTLGAVSTYGIVKAADAVEAGGEHAPGHDARLVSVAIATDSLPGLATGVVLAVDGAAHRVRQILRGEDTQLTRIIAYPVTATVPEIWMGGEIVLPWAERAAGAAAGDVVDLGALEGYPVLLFEAIAAVAGTDPALNVAVHHADLEAGPFTASGISFDEVTDEDSFQVRVLDYVGGAVKRYVRLVPAVTGTEDPAFWCQAALLSAELPR